MKIVSNGTMNEVSVLRHFMLVNEEYVLYYKTDGVFLGQIQTNKIVCPSADKSAILIKVLSNLISDNPQQSINAEHHCVLLSSNVDKILEEVSFQKTNIPLETLNKLLNTANTLSNNVVNNEVANQVNQPSKKNNSIVKIIIGIVAAIVILILGIGIVKNKDKIFEKISYIPRIFDVKNLSGFGIKNNGSFKKYSIDGIEIDGNLNTYAIRQYEKNSSGTITDYNELILRYDKQGNFKYTKYSENYYVRDEEYAKYSDKELQELANKEECQNIEQLNYSGFKYICEVKNRVFTMGFEFTDKTIAAGIKNSSEINSSNKHFELRGMLNSFEKFDTEEHAKATLEEVKSNLKADNGDILIMGNHVVHLN